MGCIKADGDDRKDLRAGSSLGKISLAIYRETLPASLFYFFLSLLCSLIYFNFNFNLYLSLFMLSVQ